MSMSMSRTVALSLICAAAIAGCSSAAPSAASPSTASPSVTAAGTTAASPAQTSAVTAVQGSDLPSSAAFSRADRKNVTLLDCSAKHGTQSASGQVVNRSASPAKYTITVYFTSHSATVLGYAVTKVDVAAGKTRSWTASKSIGTSESALCVIAGVS